MASVGSLIFYWSLLEAELSNDILRLRSGSEDVHATVGVRSSFSEQLADWRGLVELKARRNKPLSEALVTLTTEIELLRQKRNLITHNFAGASARPEDGEPHITCLPGERGGTATVIGQAELDGLVEAIDRCRLSLRGMELRYLGA